jgi:hypothetical protein
VARRGAEEESRLPGRIGWTRLSEEPVRFVATLADTLVSVWRQALAEKKPEVEIGPQTYATDVTRSSRLRTVEFPFQGRRFAGIEQNPATSSRWAALARKGQRIMQFSCDGRYVGNVCEAKLTRYPAWRALGLPE